MKTKISRKKEIFLTLGQAKIFLDVTQKALTIKEKLINWISKFKTILLKCGGLSNGHNFLTSLHCDCHFSHPETEPFS